jgi:hypothetical protein
MWQRHLKAFMYLSAGTSEREDIFDPQTRDYTGLNGCVSGTHEVDQRHGLRSSRKTIVSQMSARV